MPYLAIGSVREENGTIGIRLFNPDNVTLKDIPLNDVEYYMQRNGGIRNISIDKKGKIQWKQGSVDRYPIIDKMAKELRNENSVIVISVADTGSQKYYQVCNYTGTVTTISDNQLIAYGKKYKIANCKVVKKQGKEFIQSIEGQIPEINTKPTFSFRRDRGYMEVYMPFILSPELEIKEMTPEGALILNLKYLTVKPATSALSIRKLILSKYVKDITSGLFISMPNLEEIIIKAPDALIYDNAFMGLKKLKRVYIEGVTASGVSIFEGDEALEKVDFGTPMRYINSMAFKGCVNLDVSTVLLDGVKEIGSKAFYKNKKLEHLVIPKSVTTVAYNAFERCSGLIRVDCMTNILRIPANYSKQTGKKLLENMQPIDMYCNRSTVIDGAIAPNVKVIYREDGEQEKQLQRKKMKAGMLGVQTDFTKILNRGKDIADILLAVPQQDVTNMVQDMVNQVLKLHDMCVTSYSGSYDLSGFKVELRIEFSGSHILSARKVKNVGKFIVAMGNTLVFIPCDQVILKHHLSTPANNYNPRITVESAPSKYIKSVDISDNGLIRLIYQDKAGKVTQREITTYVIPD